MPNQGVHDITNCVSLCVAEHDTFLAYVILTGNRMHIRSTHFMCDRAHNFGAFSPNDTIFVMFIQVFDLIYFGSSAEASFRHLFHEVILELTNTNA